MMMRAFENALAWIEQRSWAATLVDLALWVPLTLLIIGVLMQEKGSYAAGIAVLALYRVNSLLAERAKP